MRERAGESADWCWVGACGSVRRGWVQSAFPGRIGLLSSVPPIKPSHNQLATLLPTQPTKLSFASHSLALNSAPPTHLPAFPAPRSSRALAQPATMASSRAPSEAPSRPSTSHSVSPSQAPSQASTSKKTQATTATSSLGDRWVIAVHEQRGVGREIGLAMVQREYSRVILTQFTDSATCVKATHLC